MISIEYFQSFFFNFEYFQSCIYNLNKYNPDNTYNNKEVENMKEANMMMRELRVADEAGLLSKKYSLAQVAYIR